MEVFFKNVSSLIHESRFNSREELSAYVFEGKGKYLANAQRKQQEISLKRAIKIADALEVPLDLLVRENAEFTERTNYLVPLLQSVTKSQKMNDLGGLLEQVDLYHAVKPNDRSLRPYRIGKNSLLSRILSRRDIANLRRGIKSLPPETDAKLLVSYSAASSGLPVLGIETFEEEIAVEPYRVSVTYVRLLLSVFGPRQIPLVLNYSFELLP